MKLLVLDNYDSFTYNLVFLIRELGCESPTVVRNDQIEIQEVDQFDKILLSPGPGLPVSAGIMNQLINTYSQSKSILGICLGHQGIAEVFGAELFNLSTVLHGIAGRMHVEDRSEKLFEGIPSDFQGTHYHSWAVQERSVPDSLVVTARDQTGMIMGLRHKELDVRGLQFHPESILTEYGAKILDNWIKN